MRTFSANLPHSQDLMAMHSQCPRTVVSHWFVALGAVLVLPSLLAAADVKGKPVATYKDASGKVTTTVFCAEASDARQHYADFGVLVADDMVCVGGGAEGAHDPSGVLLFASYPRADWTGWVGSTKDHANFVQ